MDRKGERYRELGIDRDREREKVCVCERERESEREREEGGTDRNAYKQVDRQTLTWSREETGR